MMLKKICCYIVLLLLLNGLAPASEQDIFTSVQKGQLETVASILEKQPALANASDGDGTTLLHLSLHYGQWKIAELLVERGARVTATNSYKTTPLHIALQKKNPGIADLLLKNGADINCRNVWGMTPLYRAAGRGYMESVEFLVQRKADVNLQNEYGKSPLHAAVSGGYGNIVRYLLEHGAKTDTGDKWQQTPLFFAVSGKAADMATLLIKKGSDIHHKNGCNQTVLHRAVISGYTDIARLLIENGSRVHDRDAHDMTPLDYACKYGHRQLAEFLESNGAKTAGRTTVKSKAKPKNFEFFPFTKAVPAKGEAIIWYLGHSGWAVKTKTHLLVFDYYEDTPPPAEPKLANGRINPEEIKNLQVVVFASHVHHDHYDQCILHWKKQLGNNIHYVFGWNALKDPAHTYMGPRKTVKRGTLSVESVHSPEAGEMEGNFLVRVDGLTIYHSGDYSRGHEAFKKDMDHLAAIAPGIDLFFMLAGNQMDNNEAFIALEKVKPRHMFPMHAGGSEYVFLEFDETAAKKGIKTIITCSKNRGDMFLYKDSRVQSLDSYRQIIKKGTHKAR
ncbi:MAG: hypothetical protein GY765_42180 [bacterium]|nr:hypothetical protein [bacterium]